jgi:hypothetical protein
MKKHKDTPSEKHMRSMLQAENFNIERIAISDNQRRADYLVTDDVNSYVIEVTNKEETKEYKNLLKELHENGIGSTSQVICYWNRLDGILKNKADQISQTPKAQKCFRLLWLACVHTDWQTVMRRLECTLYGMARLSLWSKDKVVAAGVQCFYYDRFAFFNTPNIDAVIFSSSNAGRLFVNDFGSSSLHFRMTRLHSLFSSSNSVVDPLVVGKSGNGLFMGLNLIGASDQEKWRYLSDTYGYKTSRMVESQFKGYVDLQDIIKPK